MTSNTQFYYLIWPVKQLSFDAILLYFRDPFYL